MYNEQRSANCLSTHKLSTPVDRRAIATGDRWMEHPEPPTSAFGGAENAGHEITGHAKAKQKTSSEAANV